MIRLIAAPPPASRAPAPSAARAPPRSAAPRRCPAAPGTRGRPTPTWRRRTAVPSASCTGKRTKFAAEGRGERPRARRPSTTRPRLSSTAGHLRLHPRQSVGDRGRAHRLGEGAHLVGAAALLHLVHQCRRSGSPADPQPGQAEGLGEGPHHEQVVPLRRESDEALARVLGVGLVEDHQPAGFGEQPLQRGAGGEPSGGVVGAADVDDPRASWRAVPRRPDHRPAAAAPAPA